MSKYIFITGGVVSSLGKGIVAASLGRLLKKIGEREGFTVTIQKFDPYLNVDPGTMSPYQHGEVFVTKDGAETDLDLGHYERFMDIELDKDSNLTSGKVYQSIIEKERKGDYLGATVQVVPHVTNFIKNKIYNKGQQADIVITEIGGTIGDIESTPFIEALRQFKNENKPEDTCFIHLALVPYLETSKEFKTKTVQHSVKELCRAGIQPDFIIYRAKDYIDENSLTKIAQFCNVRKENVIADTNSNNIYCVPSLLHCEGLDIKVLNKLNVKYRHESVWYVCEEDNELLAKISKARDKSKVLNIGLLGKYTELPDAYISVNEAIKHAAWNNGYIVNIRLINAEEIEKMKRNEIFKYLSDLDIDGVVVPGGFGERGIEGIISVLHRCRMHGLPTLGICLGMQCMAIEYTRYRLGYEDANSTEFDSNTKHPIIHLMEDQEGLKKGGTMRLGNYKCEATTENGKETFEERHRHRYEFNNDYLNEFTKQGMYAIGINKERNLVEIIQDQDNDFYVGCQFHPEFKSRPGKPHPLFDGLIKAAIKYKGDEE